MWLEKVRAARQIVVRLFAFRRTQLREPEIDLQGAAVTSFAGE